MARRDSKKRNSLSACPRCRLLHGTAALCRHCGDVAPLPLEQLVLRPQTMQLSRRVARKSGWRWFDLVFFGLLVALPLEAERRDTGLFAVTFLGLAALWALTRLGHYLATHYRLISARGVARATAIASGDVSSAAPLFEGRARKLTQTVDAVSVERRCLISELRLMTDAEPKGGEGLRLRKNLSVPFTVETEEGSLRVEGIVRLFGDGARRMPDERASELMDAELPALWLESAHVVELLVQHNDKVRLRGGTLRELAAGQRVLEGTPGAAVAVWRAR